MCTKDSVAVTKDAESKTLEGSGARDGRAGFPSRTKIRPSREGLPSPENPRGSGRPRGGPVYRCAPQIRPSRGMTAVSQNPRGVRRPGGAGRFVRIAHLGFGRVANDYRSPKNLEGPALKGARFSAQKGSGRSHERRRSSKISRSEWFPPLPIGKPG